MSSTDVVQSAASPVVFKEGAGETQTGNSNPNVAKIREYGRIEWHGSTAKLVAAGSRPLHMAALTLSTCLGVSVSAEEPRYESRGDLLDVTAPQWVAKHPDQRVFAAKPAKVEISFAVGADNSPVDLSGLLHNAAAEVNQQQPFNFEVRSRVERARSFYSFVPTQTHDPRGNLIDARAYLDERISIARQTASVLTLAGLMSEALTNATGFHFECCEVMASIPWWGDQPLTYEASNQPARKVLLDLIVAAGENRSYSQTCEPMDKRFCFIEVRRDSDQRPTKNLRTAVCSARGYDGY